MSTDKNDPFLIYYFIALFITCIIIGYLLYWLIKKSKEKEITRLKSKKKSIKSLKNKRKRSSKSDELRTKSSSSERKKASGDTQYQKNQAQTKMEAGYNQKESDLTYALQLQETAELVRKESPIKQERPLKVKSDLDLVDDAKVTSPKSEKSGRKNDAVPKKSTTKVDNLISKRLMPFNTQNQFKSEQDQPPKSILVLEPNKILKEVLNEDKKLTSSSIGSSTSHKSLYANQKVESSVMAYQTTPISIENIENGNESENYSSSIAKTVETSKPSSLSLSTSKSKSIGDSAPLEQNNETRTQQSNSSDKSSKKH